MERNAKTTEPPKVLLSCSNDHAIVYECKRFYSIASHVYKEVTVPFTQCYA
jgi:hypothetical protein